MNSDTVGPGGGTKHQRSLGLLKGICTFKCISLESIHPQHLFHDPIGTRADTLANLPLVCRGEHAKTRVGLAKNEAFSAPSSFLFSFFLCHGGALNQYSKGTRAEQNGLCLVLGALPASVPFHES